MIYLDSASEADARTAQELGYVRGITTNPKLMAATGRKPLDQLEILLRDFDSGLIFYQPLATNPTEARKELEEADTFSSGRVVFKLPAQRHMFRLAADLVAAGHHCAITGIYTPSQTLVAAAVGAEWVIPYVDRARRLRPEGDLIPEITAVTRGRPIDTKVLAASIKSHEQAVQALVDGADAVSAPLDVLMAMPNDTLTDSAVEEFAAAYAEL